MRQYILLLIATVGLAGGGCWEERSPAGMTDEKERLARDLEVLKRECAETEAANAALASDIDETRRLGNAATDALARRDALERELLALRAGATGDTATVASVDRGQVRAEGDWTDGPGGGAMGGPTPPRPRDLPGDGPRRHYLGPSYRHVVAKGESLYKIAGYPRYYNNPDAWPAIYEANADRIRDPHWIFVGLPLDVPRN